MIRIKAMAFICWIAIGTACNNKTETASNPEASASSSTFKGEIKEDVRDSKPDWELMCGKKRLRVPPTFYSFYMTIPVWRHGLHMAAESICQRWTNWLQTDLLILSGIRWHFVHPPVPVSIQAVTIT
jgi:hypothetical protein